MTPVGVKTLHEFIVRGIDSVFVTRTSSG